MRSMKVPRDFKQSLPSATGNYIGHKAGSCTPDTSLQLCGRVLSMTKELLVSDLCLDTTGFSALVIVHSDPV